MDKYTVAFTRIGRTRNVPPLVVQAADADALAKAIYKHARPYLASRDVEVIVDLDKMCGWICCGFNNGGDFTISDGES